MEEIIKLVKKLEEQKPEWREWYLSEEYSKVSFDDEAKKDVQDIIRLVRQKKKQFIDGNEEEDEQVWRENVANLLGEKVLNEMEDYMKNILSIYSDMKVIRDSNENVISFLADVMNQYFVSYSASFFSKNEKYGVQDKVLFENAINALRTVVYTHVGDHLSKQMAKRQFEQVTGIKEPYSRYYAELYEKHFDKIQRNMYIEQMNRIEDKLDYLISRLRDGNNK